MKSKIYFTKMHGVGNDFIVIDSRAHFFDWNNINIKQLSDRHQGIGFDQLLVIENAVSNNADFHYRIFNQDGSEATHCGNGARCFAKYLLDNQLFDFHRPVRLSMHQGIITISYQGKKSGIDYFEVNMGTPDFTPFTELQESKLYQPITVQNTTLSFGIVSMGNPHATCQVENIKTIPVQQWGQSLQNHPLFPKQVNVGFMEIVHRHHIRLRVFERGVGETLACGTGACAAVAIGIARGDLDDNVTVSLPGGQLTIQWQEHSHTLYMCGPATTVFTGEICPEIFYKTIN